MLRQHRSERSTQMRSLARNWVCCAGRLAEYITGLRGIASRQHRSCGLGRIVRGVGGVCRRQNSIDSRLLVAGCRTPSGRPFHSFIPVPLPPVARMGEHLGRKALKINARYWAGQGLRLARDYLPLWAVPLLIWFFIWLLSGSSYRERHRNAVPESAQPHVSPFRLVGYVTKSVDSEGGPRRTVVVRGAIVEVGGFRAVSDSTGIFELPFSSPSRHSIPVIVRADSVVKVFRVSFPADRARLSRTFPLD